MGAMKSLKMGKVLGTIRRKNTSSASGAPDSADPQGDGPEAIAGRSVIAFCESGAPNNSGDEVLYLPPIVESAESSPQAAAECAHLIRKYLKKDYWSKPTYQYNALMLMRILADNPGETFTRNVDQKFVDTVKELLRAHRSQQVDQMLFETLNVFETTKSYDEGLLPLIEMWKKEKEKAQKSQPRHMQQQQQQPPPQMMQAQPFVANPHSQNYFARNHHSRRLPDAVELAGRLEEARTSAKLLQQVVANTPPGEILDNDLIKEFADRCTSASRSIQNYMSAENPAPDNDTMESMIDTNEQLQAALSLHQRALLNAKKQLGVGTPASEDSTPILAVPQPNGAGSSRRPSPAPAAPDSDDDYEPPPMPPRRNGKGKEREYDNMMAGPSGSNTPRASEDPFADPKPEATANGGAGGSGSGSGAGAVSSSRYQDDEARFPHEPYHPGFNATPSYLGRQESALGKETMHGAASGVNERVPEESDDIYNTTPQKNKGPMYRY